MAIIREACGTLHNITQSEFSKLAKMSFGRSSADIVTVVSDAIYAYIYEAIGAKAFRQIDTRNGTCFAPCEVTHKHAKVMKFDDVPCGSLMMKKLSFSDIKKVIEETGPSVSGFSVRQINRFARKLNS
jgi:hypothetical protein